MAALAQAIMLSVGQRNYGTQGVLGTSAHGLGLSAWQLVTERKCEPE